MKVSPILASSREETTLTGVRLRFMPNIGKYMLNVLDGKTNGLEKDKAFGWKTRTELEAAEIGVKRELRDFEAGGSTPRL